MFVPLRGSCSLVNHCNTAARQKLLDALWSGGIVRGTGALFLSPSIYNCEGVCTIAHWSTLFYCLMLCALLCSCGRGYAPAAPTHKIVTSISTPTVVQPSVTPPSIPTVSATAIATAIPVPTKMPALGHVKVNANVRNGPGTRYGVISSLTAGNQVAIDGRNEVGDWYKLHGEGWVSSGLVDVAEPSALAIVSAAPTSAPLPTSTTDTGAVAKATEAASQSTTTERVPNYRIAKVEDVSFATAVRLSYRVVVDHMLTESQLRLVCQDLIAKQTVPVNALSFLFYLPDTDTNGVYTAGKADWAPNGVWADADKVQTGDYSHHKLVVSVGSALGPTAEPASSTIPEAIRRKIFYDLVSAQDSGMDVEQSEAFVAQKYGIGADVVSLIGGEGMSRGWPMPTETP